MKDDDDYVLDESVQMFWPVCIEPLDEDKWFDDDYDGPTYDTPEEQIPLLPDLFDKFSTSWQSMNSPYAPEDIPKGVKVHGIFFTFDKELGVCVCANYKFSYKLLRSSEAFKKVIKKLADEIETGFDSWLNTHFIFKHDGKRFSITSGASAKRIVAPVECHDQLFFKWDDVDDVGDVEMALSHDNDCFNIIWRPKEHKKEVDRIKDRIERLTKIVAARGENPDEEYCIIEDKKTLEAFEFVKKHKKQYFFGHFN